MTGKGPAIPYSEVKEIPKPKVQKRLTRTTRIKKRHKTKGGRNSDPEKLAWLRSLRCPLYPEGCGGRVEVHHDRKMGARASDERTIALCANHHRLGQYSIQTLGREGWQKHHGRDIDLMTAQYEVEWHLREVSVGMLATVKAYYAPSAQ